MSSSSGCGHFPRRRQRPALRNPLHPRRYSHRNHIFGWSNEPDKLAAAADLMPITESTYTLDRETKHEWTITRLLRNAPFCRICGVVRLASEKNKSCKGPAKLRAMEKLL